MAALISSVAGIRSRWEDPGGRIGMAGMLGELLASGNTGALSSIIFKILPQGTDYSNYLLWNGTGYQAFGDTSIALGNNAGVRGQGLNAIAIGFSAGFTGQSSE